MGIEISRHEISKGKDGRIVKGIIGVNYTNPVTGRVAYTERVFTVGTGGDFLAIPTKVEFLAKIKAWLTTIPIQGKSVLQNMKDQTDLPIETFSALKAGETDSLVKTPISEDIIL